MTTSSAPVLVTARFALEPLVVAHAREMVAVLADPALYRFTGGEPPSPAALGALVATAVVASGVVSEAAEAAPGAEHPARTTTPARAAVPRASRETGIR